METYELYTLAFEVNEKLGYRLFRDIYSYSLRRDFERVAKAVETYKKKENNEVYEVESLVETLRNSI